VVAIFAPRINTLLTNFFTYITTRYFRFSNFVRGMLGLTIQIPPVPIRAVHQTRSVSTPQLPVITVVPTLSNNTVPLPSQQQGNSLPWIAPSVHPSSMAANILNWCINLILTVGTRFSGIWSAATQGYNWPALCVTFIAMFMSCTAIAVVPIYLLYTGLYRFIMSIPVVKWLLLEFIFWPYELVVWVFGIQIHTPQITYVDVLSDWIFWTVVRTCTFTSAVALCWRWKGGILTVLSLPFTLGINVLFLIEHYLISEPIKLATLWYKHPVAFDQLKGFGSVNAVIRKHRAMAITRVTSINEEGKVEQNHEYVEIDILRELVAELKFHTKDGSKGDMAILRTKTKQFFNDRLPNYSAADIVYFFDEALTVLMLQPRNLAMHAYSEFSQSSTSY
jgi:hypothetical protein